MAGIALVLDLLKRKNTCLAGYCISSHGLFSATSAASAAASSLVVTAPFATWAFFGKGLLPVGHCDAGQALTEDYASVLNELPGSIFQKEPVYLSTKEYNIELKSLFSAFHWKNLALTSLRSFLLFYLPLLESQANMEDDDDDFLPDTPEEQRPDLVVPFKKSLKQIVRETTVVTTRRVLERLAVHYVSQRWAWKLLKDASKSATRKAVRGMPTTKYVYCVSRTTFRAHFLGIVASWLLQVGLDVYRFFSRMFSSKDEIDEVDRVEQIQQLGVKIYVATLRCGSSLVFASIGAGLGAVFFRPSTGQWIGCAIGDLAGPLVVSYCFDKLFHVDL